MTGAGGRVDARGPRLGPLSMLWAFIAMISLVFAIVTVWQFSTLLFGTPGTGRVLRCGEGDNRYCTIEWTAGGRSGTERMELGGEPGGAIPVRVLGDNVVDARMGAWVFTGAMMLLFLAAALVTVFLPAVVLARRSMARSRARHHPYPLVEERRRL